MISSEPAGRTLLLVRRLGAAAALVVVGAAVASALGSPVPAPAEASTPTTPPAATGPPPPTAPPCPRGQPATGAGVVNINEATAEQLQLLPGIGPAKAARILELRHKRGRFSRLRDLRRVKGIGARTLRRLEPMLALEGPTTLTAKAKPR